MNRLTEIAIEKSKHGVFTRAEVTQWVGGSAEGQFSLVKRALMSGEIVRVRRGLYCLAAKYVREKVDPFVLAQRVYGPSYVSLESALSYHGWIPEAVYGVTSASMDRSREFATAFGQFGFVRVPQRVLYAGVSRVEKGEGGKGGSFALASGLKALCDYVYVKKRDWTSVEPVVESLRVERSALASVGEGEVMELMENYDSLRVRRFLKGFWKDVKP